MLVFVYCLFFFFKQKTAYEMRISDWSSDVCSSDLDPGRPVATGAAPSRPRESRHHLYLSRSYRDPRRYGGCGRRGAAGAVAGTAGRMSKRPRQGRPVAFATITPERPQPDPVLGLKFTIEARHGGTVPRSDEHTSD